MAGKKFDEGKAPVTQFLRQFPLAIECLAKLSEYGHKQYGEAEDDAAWDNWKKVPNALFRYEQARGRHLIEKNGEIDESGFYHVAHDAWDALAVLQLKLERDLKASDEGK